MGSISALGTCTRSFPSSPCGRRLTRRDVLDASNFTIQRATNLEFTLGLSTSTVPGSTLTVTQTVSDNTTYYFRIRANNGTIIFSGWVPASPLPITTNP